MKYYINLLIQVICFCPLTILSQSDTVAFFDFEILKVEVDSKGNVASSLVNNHGEFQDAVPFKNRTVAYGNSHSYRNVEFGNYPVGQASTDNKGTYAYNMDLSRRRAENIKKIMVDSGIKENRIITLGNGVRQLGNNKTDASLARKASFVLLH